jgi:hypothetical protein
MNDMANSAGGCQGPPPIKIVRTLVIAPNVGSSAAGSARPTSGQTWPRGVRTT